MRRLNPLRDERGASAVTAALVMVVLMGFAALAIDVAVMQAERQQLQTGADAAALAVAQDCAGTSCGTPEQTAQYFVAANATTGDGDVQARLAPVPTPAAGTVTVEASGISEHLFAPVLGIDETALSARATATWGAPSGGTSALPLAFSWCEFQAQTGGGIPSGTTARTIHFTKSSGTTCTGPSGNVVAGGFGWLRPDPSSCSATTSMDHTLYSDPGSSVPSTCTVAGVQAVQNQTVLLPVFDAAGDTGSNAWYTVYGYAAFRVTGYHFAGQYSWNAPCNGSARCIRGYFVEFVELDDAFTHSPTAPHLGASMITLSPDTGNGAPL